MPFHPLDPLLVVLYAAVKLRRVRGLILVIGLVPALLYALPAQPCGCIRTPFVRCSGSGRELAYRAALRSDLKNLASQEEIYFSDFEAYSADPRALGFTTSWGVNVTLVATPGGWAARATHDALDEGQSCVLKLGTEVPHAFELLDEARPGELACTF